MVDQRPMVNEHTEASAPWQRAGCNASPQR